MKRIINICLPALLIALLPSLQGCTKSAHDDVQGDGTLIINATLDNMKISPSYTRSIEDINLYDKLFKVVGFKTMPVDEEEKLFEEVKTTITPNLYGGEQFIKPVVDDKGRLVTNPRTWDPALGSYISFFAFSDNTPDSGTHGIVAHSDKNNVGYPWLDIDLQPAPYIADGSLLQGDIVAAQVMDEPNYIVFSAIDMNFKHILSKLSFKTFSSVQSKINITDLTYKITNVGTKSRFTFNGASKGALGTFNTTNQSTLSFLRIYPSSAPQPTIDQTNNTTATAITLGNMLLIPQAVKDGFIELTIKYKIEISQGNWSSEITKVVPLRAPESGEVASGSHYQYNIDITMNEINISVEGIEDWNTDRSALPIVFGPKGDVMVEYTANEPPYVDSNGTMWVLDHSGYNRHGKIVGTTTKYDSGSKSYEFSTTRYGNDNNSYIEIPNIPNIDEDYTIEMIMRSPKDTDRGELNTSYSFEDTKGNNISCLFHSYYQNFVNRIIVNNNFGSNFGSFFRNLPYPLYNNFSLWTFSVSKKFEMFSRNNNAQITTKMNEKSFSIGELKQGKIGSNFGGNVRYFRLTKSGTSMDQVESRFNKLKTEYSIGDKVYPTYAVYNNDNDNIIARFRSSQAPFVDADGNRYWEDLSGRGNHLLLSPGVGYDPNEGFSKGYIFNGTDAYMKFTHKLPISNSNISLYSKFSLIDEETSTDRVLVHMATEDTYSLNTPLIQFCPYNDGGTPRSWSYSYNEKIAYDDFPEYLKYGRNFILNYIDLSSYKHGLMLYPYGFQSEKYGGIKDLSTRTFSEINHIYIGCAADKTRFYKGYIHNIILYNKAVQYTPKNVNCEASLIYMYEATTSDKLYE